MMEHSNLSTEGLFGFLEYQIPFCEPFLCSTIDTVNSDDDYYREVKLWGCMPTSCRKNMEMFVALIAILSLVTTWLNIIVLSANLLQSTRRILGRNPTMQNYSNYVISLALADLVMGVFVAPLAAIFFYKQTNSPRIAARINTTFVQHFGFNDQETETDKERFQHLYQTDQFYYVPTDVVNITNNSPGLVANPSQTVLHLLGFFTHLSIIVSLYTLAASSADRFYVSTKPNKNRGISLSRSSLRRMSIASSCDGPACLAFSISRSSIVVISIWLMGFFFSLTPFWAPGTYHHHVGHVFAALSFHDDRRLTFSWYIAILTLPLLVTWLFSFLLCFHLRRRKRKLKKFSKHLSKQDLSERKLMDRTVNSSFAMTSRCSNTETPMGPMLNSSSSGNVNSTNQNEVFPEVFENESSEQNQVVQNNAAILRPKLLVAPSASLPCTRRRRPSSLDSSLIACKVDEETKKTIIHLKSNHNIARENLLSKCHSTEDGLTASYVAKRILFRRSWEGTSLQEGYFQISSNSSLSSSLIKRSECQPPSKNPVTTPPTSPSQSYSRRTDSTRSARPTAARIRRRSSIYRAKDFIMSNSFESNIVRTLLAVIAVFTVAVLPLLIVLFQIAPSVQASPAQKNKHATSLVVSVTVLLSNSLWNCLIYGIRMPYFRSAMAQILRKLFRCRGNFSCTNFFTWKFGLTNSYRRDSDISKPTWM